MKRTAPLAAAWLLAAPTLAASGAALSSSEMSALRSSTRVAREVVSELERLGHARVFVSFHTQPVDGSVGREAPQAAPSPDRIARVREALLDRLQGEIEVTRAFRTVDAFAGVVTLRGAWILHQAAEVWRVDLDAGGRGGLAEAVPLTNLDVVRTLGWTGRRVTVAVVDSGIDSDHPDLADDLVAEHCFCSDNGSGCCPNGGTEQDAEGAAEDDYGHGTWVSGVVTSDGVQASLGAAPDAGVVAVKVLDENNSFCCASDVVAALDWISSSRPDVDVVNLSLGTGDLFTDDCDDARSYTRAFATAIRALAERGVPTVAASLNGGSATQMSAPACVSEAISVGATWDANVGSGSVLGCFEVSTRADQVACFSNSSATTDIFAPGGRITTSNRGGGTASVYGTSFSAPMVSGCLADLLEARPFTPVSALEAAIEASPVRVTDSRNGRSYPRLDCAAALDTLTAGEGDCQPDANTLCLNRGRFEVTASFEAPPASAGLVTAYATRAAAVPLTGDTGYFWFFNQANVEVVVKVLDACDLPGFGNVWVFAGGLTDVGVDLSVRDTVTGEVFAFSNPVGRPFELVRETDRFESSCPLAASATTATGKVEAPVAPTAIRRPPVRVGPSPSGGPTCAVEPIACGQQVHAQLSATDCVAATGTADFWVFDGEAGDEVSIDLASSEFDTLLYLFDPELQVAALDDDGGVGTNAHIAVTLDQAGEWAIGVTGTAPSQLGSYDLSLTCSSGGGSCVPGPTTLCLNGGRFRVEADWRTELGSGSARVVELTEDTGYLWFFNAANVEAVVKVLDACGVPGFGNFWVYAGGLTDQEVEFVVTDTATGETMRYFNPLGRPFALVRDTDHFLDSCR